MSTREEYAKAAMAAIISTIRTDADYERLRGLAAERGDPSVSAWIAHKAYSQADAMMTEANYRAKETP